MLKRMLILAVALILLAGLALPAVSRAEIIMYVYTENGKSLNVRQQPTVGNNVIGTLPYGESVYVESTLGNGWSQILWGSYGSAYVQSRFLVSVKPGSRPSTRPSSGGSSSSSSGKAATAATTVEELNRIFRSYRKVNPYTVTARPVRASGWVNLRWTPTTNAEVIATYRNGDRLTVIAELGIWLQVEDSYTGMVGFMDSTYVSK